MIKKITHLTSVHSYNDPRIFYKECQSLALAGFEVALVVPHEHDLEENGVKVLSVPKPRNRTERLTKTVWQVFKRGLDSKADAYHFHDPELIPVGLLLRIMGKKVVYDVHEDYVTGIAEKYYLPAWLRGPSAKLFGFFEKRLSWFFTLVLAEKYYKERLTAGHVIANYPAFEPFSTDKNSQATSEEAINLLYTGNIAEVRGALHHALVPTYREDLTVSLIGRYKPEIKTQMLEKAGAASDRVNLIGDGAYVPFADIVREYESGKYLAGLALFPPTKHYLRKELTKFFEYMAAGLPIICSDFPHWKTLIEGSGVGICVDPTDKKQILAAIDKLKTNPELARKMGAKGHELIRSRFNWNAAAADLVALYRK